MCTRIEQHLSPDGRYKAGQEGEHQHKVPSSARIIDVWLICSLPGAIQVIDLQPAPVDIDLERLAKSR